MRVWAIVALIGIALAPTGAGAADTSTPQPAPNAAEDVNPAQPDSQLVPDAEKPAGPAAADTAPIAPEPANANPEEPPAEKADKPKPAQADIPAKLDAAKPAKPKAGAGPNTRKTAQAPVAHKPTQPKGTSDKANPAMPGLGSNVVPPHWITQPMPPAPQGFPNSRPEGWALVRFTVLANGTTADARVVDAMPDDISQSQAIGAVKSWTYKPATVNGQPVDWYNNAEYVVFDNPSIGLAATPLFLGSINAAQSLMTKGDAAAAKAKIETALHTAATLNELGIGETVLFRADYGLGDFQAAYDAIVRATPVGLDLLWPEQLVAALQYRFTAEARLGRYDDALTTYARITAMADPAANNPVTKDATTIRAALAGDDALPVAARLDNGTWHIALSRRTFSLRSINGEVRAIDIECNRHKATIAYQAGVEWTLPAGWGACGLDVRGRPATTFTLDEFKAPSEGPAAPELRH